MVTASRDLQASASDCASFTHTTSYPVFVYILIEVMPDTGRPSQKIWSEEPVSLGPVFQVKDLVHVDVMSVFEAASLTPTMSEYGFCR